MSPSLPVTAAPGAATTSSFRRENSPPPRAPESRRLRGSGEHFVFVGFSQRPKQDEALMAPEISWCEAHCKGFWNVEYGPETRGQGQPMRFAFQRADDADAFKRWRQERRDHHASPEDFE